MEWLDLRNVVLVGQGWGGLLGLTLPQAQPGRYQGLLVMDTLLAAQGGAYDAPFPDRGHSAALRAFPAWGAQDPVPGWPSMQALQHTIRNCPVPRVMPYAGHGVPEPGAEVAREAVEYFRP